MKQRVSRRAGEKSSPPALSRLAEDITDQVLAALREGVRPWQQPWDSGLIPPGQDGRPRRHSGEGYAGINVLLLWLAAGAGGYASPHWMTYRQAQAYGGQVRRGEKGTVIVYADRYRKTVLDEESGEETERLIPFLKTYTVFNAEQIDGLPEKFRPVPEIPLTPAPAAERVEAVEVCFRESGAVIRHTGDTPCYIPAFDEIRLPAPGAFRSVQQYYATLAHELIHNADIRIMPRSVLWSRKQLPPAHRYRHNQRDSRKATDRPHAPSAAVTANGSNEPTADSST